MITVLSLAVLLSGCGQENTQDSDVRAAETVSASSAAESETVAVSETEALTVTVTAAQTQKATEEKKEEPSDERSQEDIEQEFENFKENVVVIGDSIALGYGAYERLPLKNVFAKQSVALTKIDEYEFDYAGMQATSLEVIGALQPENIILSMGLNDIISYSAEEFTEMYREFSDSVLEASPDSEIYIMGLSPVVSDCTYVKNDKINDYNDTLSNFFEDYNRQIHFVNAACVLRDGKGFLDNQYSSGDGIHLTGEAYDLMLEELANYIYK